MDKTSILSIATALLIGGFMLWYFSIFYTEKETYGYKYGKELVEFCSMKGLKYYGGSSYAEGTIQHVSCCASEEAKLGYWVVGTDCKRFQVN